MKASRASIPLDSNLKRLYGKGSGSTATQG